MDQTPPTSPGAAAAATPDPAQAHAPAPAGDRPASQASPAGAAHDAEQQGFASRGRMRRRVRFLRKARELAYRDLGGLVFNLHRFGQRNDPLVLAKLNLLGQIDNELRTLEHALAEHQPITVLREAGITACPRCAAIHSSEDRFCPRCGMPTGRHPDLPIAVAGAGADAPPSTPAPATAATRAPAAPPAPAPSAPSASPGPPPSTTSSPPSTPGRNAGANAQPAPVAATPSGAQHPTEQHDSVPADGPERAAATPREDITEVVRPSAKGP